MKRLNVMLRTLKEVERKKIKVNKVEHAYRLPPCQSYDIERMESWLGSMAEKGLILSKDGFFAGFAVFEKGEPRSVNYRLEAAPKGTSIFSDDCGAPDEEAVKLRETYGWRYLTNCGKFYIYDSETDDAREWNINSEIQARIFNMIRKNSIINASFFLIIFLVFWYRENMLLRAVEIGSWLFLGGVLLVLWAFCRLIIRIIQLGKLHQKLASGKELDHKKDWKKNATPFYVKKIAFIFLCVIWIGFFLHVWDPYMTNKNKQNIADYTEELPIANISDMETDGLFSLVDGYFPNTIEISSDILAPYILSFCEDMTGKMDDGNVIHGKLYVDYYETISSIIAREIAREYQKQDKRTYSKYYEERTLPELDVDYSAAYCTTSPTVILQEGKKVVRIRFLQISENYSIPMNEWVQVFADSIK